jgi:hypothetical protein
MDDSVYTESPENRMVIIVTRVDGSSFLTNCSNWKVDEEGLLIIERKFEIFPPRLERTQSMVSISEVKIHIGKRVLPKGQWIELQDVTDRIRPVEAKELQDADPRGLGERGAKPEPVVRPPDGGQK